MLGQLLFHSLSGSFGSSELAMFRFLASNMEHVRMNHSRDAPLNVIVLQMNWGIHLTTLSSISANPGLPKFLKISFDLWAG